MERRDDPLLQGRAQVDQQVPARDQVDVREGRVGRHVLPREDAHLAEGLADPVPVLVAGEEAAEPLRRDLRLDADRVDTQASPPQRHDVAEVGGEDLDRRPGRPVLEILQQYHGQRVGLLAARAARHPHTDGDVGVATLEDLREDDVLERLEGLRVAEEAGDIDEEVVVERLDLGGLSHEELDVAAQALPLIQHHAAHDPAPDHALPVRTEVNARGRMQDLQDLAEVPAVGGVHPGGDVPVQGHQGIVPDPLQRAGELRGRQDHVDAAALDGALRHAGVLGRRLILGEHDAAAGLDLLDADRAVRSGPRQDHPDGAGPTVFGQRLEKVIDRQVRTADLPAGSELQDTPGDGQDRARGDDVDLVGGDLPAVRRLRDGQAAGLAQQLDQVALVVGVEVLDQHERHAGLLRQLREELADRLQAPGRRPDPDDREGHVPVRRFRGCLLDRTTWRGFRSL